MLSLFDEFLYNMGMLDRFNGSDIHPGNYPSIKVYDEEDRILVMAEMPGLEKENVNVSFLKNVLTIEGEREVYGGNKYTFKRSYGVREKIKIDKIDAKYENGILEIVLPKEEKEKPITIPITVPLK